MIGSKRICWNTTIGRRGRFREISHRPWAVLDLRRSSWGAFPEACRRRSGVDLRSRGLGAAPRTTAPSDSSDQSLNEIVVTGTLIRGTGAPVGLDSDAGGSIVSCRRPAATTSSTCCAMCLKCRALGRSEAQRSGTGGATNITLGNSIDLRGLSPYATLDIAGRTSSAPAGTSGITVDPDSFPSIMLQTSGYRCGRCIGHLRFRCHRRCRQFNFAARRRGRGDERPRRLGGRLQGAPARRAPRAQLGKRPVQPGIRKFLSLGLNGPEAKFLRVKSDGRGGSDYSSTQCNPGNIMVGGTSYAIPAGGVTPANAAALAAEHRQSLRCGQIPGHTAGDRAQQRRAGLRSKDRPIRISIYGDATYARRDFTSAVRASNRAG